MGAAPTLVNAYLDGTEVVLLRREGAKVVEERRRATWDFFVEAATFPDALRQKCESSAHCAALRRDGDYFRLSWRSPEARRKLADPKDRDGVRSPFARAGLRIHEGDVHPVKRLLVDEQVEIQKPSRVYVDIETDSRASFPKAKAGYARVLCYSLVDQDKRVIARGMLDEDEDADEVRLLSSFWKAIEPYDQVVAWSSRTGDTFDFRVLRARSRHLGVRHPDARRWLWVDHLKAYLKMNLQVAESGDEKASHKLQDVAMAVLGEGKDDFDARHTWEAWAAGGESRQKLADYNLQDTLLLPRIEEETGYLALVDAIAEVCGIFADSSAVNALTQIDTYLLRLAREHGIRFGTGAFRDDEDEEEEQQFRGAYVMKPTIRGIGRDVHVVDFARLYPSIIITYNMSPETKVPRAPLNGPIAEGCCRTPATGITFRTDREGILPIFLRRIAKLRKHWRDLKATFPPGTPEAHDADRKSNAYKVLMNAAYGVIGSRFGRYFDVEIAESVTQVGVWLIKRVVSGISNRDWRAVYVDTDGAYLQGPSAAELREFVRDLNERDFPEVATSKGCACNDISLEYEKQFDRIVFPLSSDGETVAKRYAGRYLHYKGKPAEVDSEPEIKGLEFKRGDSARLARRLQERLIRMLLGDWDPPERCECGARFRDPSKYERKHGAKRPTECRKCGAPRGDRAPPVEDVEEYRRLIARARDYVLKGDLGAGDVVLAAGLSKSIKEYAVKKKKDGTDAAQPPHVAVARELQKRGAEVGEGSKVAYVVVDASNGIRAIPADDWKEGDPFDRYYLWESRIWPAAERVLRGAFPEQDWSEFDSVRPRKRRGVDEEKQAKLFVVKVEETAEKPTSWDGPLFSPKAVTDTRVSVARQARRGGPYVIEATSDELGDRSDRLKAILLQHPGTRPVRLVLRLLDAARNVTGIAEVDLGISVAGSAELAGKIRRLLAEPWPDPVYPAASPGV